MKKISTKNILTKIFKKTSIAKIKKKTVTKAASKNIKKKTKVLTNKVSKKKTKSLKPVKSSLKKEKKISKITSKKSTKTSAQEKIEPKSDNLRISKSNEIKPEIKKVKKQETEKREFKVKDYVVYPKHGVGKITAIEKANIGEIDIQFYKILVEKEKLTLTVPINQQSKLRHIASTNQINKCISILKTKPKIKRTMWSRRAQEYDQKINSGKIYELAEVVKDLNKNTDIIADQSYSERQLFEKAYERLKSEFEAVLSITPEEVQSKMDKALGRNQNITEAE